MSFENNGKGLWEVGPATGPILLVVNEHSRQAHKIGAVIDDVTEVFGAAKVSVVQSLEKPDDHAEMIHQEIAKFGEGEHVRVGVASGDKVAGSTLTALANGNRTPVGLIMTGGGGDLHRTFVTRRNPRPSDILNSCLTAVLHPVEAENDNDELPWHIIKAAAYISFIGTPLGAERYNELSDSWLPELIVRGLVGLGTVIRNRPAALINNVNLRREELRELAFPAIPHMAQLKPFPDTMPSSTTIDAYGIPGSANRLSAAHQLVSGTMGSIRLGKGRAFSFTPTDRPIPMQYDGDTTWAGKRLVIPVGAKISISRGYHAAYPLVLGPPDRK